MRTRAALAFAAVLAVGAVVAPRASAQYFGQNQVQYRDFNFEVLKTAHFDVYYYPEEKASAEEVGRLAERWYERFSTLFHHKMKTRQPVMLYASPSDFRQTNIVSDLGEGTGGVTEALKRRVVMPSAGALAETNHVLGHELVHAFQYDINSRRGGRMSGGGGNFFRLPLWFVEGMAEYFSLGPVDPQTAMWLRDAVESKKLPTLKQLGNPRFFPYRFGHAFWAYVGGRWGDDEAIALFRDASRSGDAVASIKKVLGQDEKTFSKEWGDSIRRTYAGFLEANKSASYYGPMLIGKKRGGGELNLGPALSPDGKRIVYLSERDLFSIDLFLADADTGKVIRKLASTATDAHFDSLEFIESAGAWSADGRRFVQSAVRKGRGAFFVVDPDSGKRLQEVDFRDVDEIENPVFTPDGTKVIFSGLQGGLFDLWEYDLKSGQRRRLTNDAFAELQPAVSPDGTKLAFTTDRFTTRLDTLAFGPYRIAILDLATGSVRELPGFPDARNSNPQWSPDGKTIYFLSDVRGGTDIHRVDLATGELREVTQLRTGVYGITALSPSLSVAHDTGRIAFTVREDGKHNIYAIDDPVKQAGLPVPANVADVREARTLARLDEAPKPGSAAAGVPEHDGQAAASEPAGQPKTSGEPTTGSSAQTSTSPSATTAQGRKKGAPAPASPPPPAAPAGAAPGAIQGGTAVLPPYTRVESRVEDMLQDPNTGLPGPDTPAPKTVPYSSKLELQYVGQPSIGVGIDRFGTYAGGSTALYFSDMLGNHNLALSVQTFGELRDIAGQALYTNLSHRLDWGVGAQFVPYLYSGGITESLTPTGEIVDQYLLERQTDAAIFGIAAYPLSRADRFEVQGTLRRFGFSAELRTDAYDFATGTFLGEDKQSIDTGLASLYLGSFSGAFVHDTSVFGATSPILGQRFRVEAGPTFGSVQYTDVLADWRGYFMPVRPVTIALRGMHFGRYGSGADDPRFGSIYLGYPDLIRGYDNIDVTECTPTSTSQCPQFDRLFGSRILVGNAEVRAPLWGLFKGQLSYGPLPVEIAAFADAGVAWTGSCTSEVNGNFNSICAVGNSGPKIFGGNQDFLTSVGAAIRVNVLGFLVAQISYAHPFQRPGKSWVWQWSLSPGF